MDKSRDELWEDINDLEEECLGYQAEVEELKDKIEELETENDALREKNNRLREEKTATENELKAEKITKTIFEADIQRLRALNEDYQNRPGTFQDQSGKYEDALDRTGLASEINSLEHDKRELKRKINQLEKEKQAWHIERAGLMLKSANSFESHSDCRKEMMKYCGERDTALARVQALEREQYGIMEESLEANRLLEHYKKVSNPSFEEQSHYCCNPNRTLRNSRSLRRSDPKKHPLIKTWLSQGRWKLINKWLIPRSCNLIRRCLKPKSRNLISTSPLER